MLVGKADGLEELEPLEVDGIVLTFAETVKNLAVLIMPAL